MKGVAARAACVAMIGFLLTMPAAASIVVDFDDLTTDEMAWGIPHGYAGLEWSRKWSVMSSDYYGSGASGYDNGIVSGNYTAFNSGGGAVAVSSDVPFTLVGAYFTAAWRDGLQIDVVGQHLGDVVYTTVFTVNTQEPTWVQFDWIDVDKVTFSSSGGEPADYSYLGYQFALDDLTFHTPAPGALLLAGMGAGVTGWLRRRRAL